MELDQVSDLEREAIRIRFLHQNPNASPADEPGPEESARLLTEIRARQHAIEGETLKMLNHKLRTPGGRSGLASRHSMALFQYVAVPAIVILGLIAIAMLIMALTR